MRKRILSAIVSIAMLASLCGAFAIPANAATTPQYQEKARVMEKLNRGLIAVYQTASTQNGITSNGVYLSWRLFGDEPIATQEFDIYKDGTKIYTTTGAGSTTYFDKDGTTANTYKVVKAGASQEDVSKETGVKPSSINNTADEGYVNADTSEPNSFTYVDIPIVMPADVTNGGGKTSTYKRTRKDGGNIGGANDASVGDLDGDGDYEIVLKWDPQDSKDSSGGDYTGNVYIDGYEIDPNNDGYLWRIDLGVNITAGQHYTQFIVYDFDGDGEAEIACKTAPGSYTLDKNGDKHYVTEVGDTAEIKAADNTKNWLDDGSKYSKRKGKNVSGPEYLTIFRGSDGMPLYTTDYIPRGNLSDWGDDDANRSERYLAGVAYLDGVHPSLIMTRGYYKKAVMRAYSWDGETLSLTTEWNGVSNTNTSIYGQGCHSLTVADIDNDGKDEIVFGSAVADDDGTVYYHNKYGHGDALHASDFNNDGVQEIYMVHEDGKGSNGGKVCDHAIDLRRYNKDTKKVEYVWVKTETGDIGRGVMGNVDDTYAAANDNARSLCWSSADNYAHDFATGAQLLTCPGTTSGSTFAQRTNFLVYWDGDLGREVFDDNIIVKYYADSGISRRFYDNRSGYSVSGSSNNHSKAVPSLLADLWGDWREEIIMPVNDGDATNPALRIFTSTLPTQYRLPTLMHDSQYRCAIAWQNVGYNQPPHTSYYIGTNALASGTNYLAPATPYTLVTYSAGNVEVTGMTLADKDIRVEKGKTETINAVIEPADATKKSLTWTSSNEAVATVSNGTVRGIAPGTVTITATTKDKGFTDTCQVTVYEVPVTGVTLSDEAIELGVGNTKALTANVVPENASDKGITWTTEDSSVATVSSDGTVTGLGYGTTNIVATAADGKHSAKCAVTVKPMTVVDINSDDAFVSTTNTSSTGFTGTATDATLALSASTDAKSEFHKDFTPYSENVANLAFNFETGGTKLDNTNWNWTGHEYTFNLEFLDEDGENILSLSQGYQASAQKLISKVGKQEPKNFESDWTQIVSGMGNIQGSIKRWFVDFDFDYDNDLATVEITAMDKNWNVSEGKYTKTFSLNGANFKTLQFYITKDGEGGVTASPKIQDLTYTLITTADGDSELLYEKGTEARPWTGTEITTDWTQNNKETAQLEYNTDEKRIEYNPDTPKGAYNASKKFGVSDNAVVAYDIDWYYESATGSDNYEYIKIGSDIAFGWTDGYKLCLSTDGGTTWDTEIETGANNTPYTKNIKAEFDTTPNEEGKITLKSLTIDGTKLKTDFVLSDNASADGVEFGLIAGGEIKNWGYPNGIKSIRVSQFVPATEPAEVSDIAGLTLLGKEGKTASVSYSLPGGGTPEGSAVLIGALYDGNRLVEVKTKRIFDISGEADKTHEIIFNGDIGEYDVKIMMWNSLGNMGPLADATSEIAN